MSTIPQRATITACPHNGRHNNTEGYIVDTYADGTVAIDMGFNHTCITPGWEELPPLKRTAIHIEDEAIEPETLVKTPKRRGRPPRAKAEKTPNREPKRRGRPPKQSPLDELLDGTEAELQELHKRKAETPQPPLLTITALQGKRVTLSYHTEHSTVEATNVTAGDLVAIYTIIEALLLKEGYD